MRRSSAVWLALSLVALARPAGATSPLRCPAIETRASELPERLAAEMPGSRPLAPCDDAAERLAGIYEALADHPRRREEAQHALVGDAVNLYVEAHAHGGPPALICRADGLLLRHLGELRDRDRATAAFEIAVARARTRLHARLAARREHCETIDAGMVELARLGTRGEAARDRLLAPGELMAAARDRRAPRSEQRRWQSAKRAGVAMMGLGLLTIGAGIAAGAADGAARQGLLQGGLLVGGTLMFVGGFPLLIVADQRVRAAVAMAPTGLAVRF